jgi:hypothetical protein
VETPPPQYDLINFYLLKEDVVWLESNISLETWLPQ